MGEKKKERNGNGKTHRNNDCGGFKLVHATFALTFVNKL